jgi:hypothetical protein
MHNELEKYVTCEENKIVLAPVLVVKKPGTPLKESTGQMCPEVVKKLPDSLKVYYCDVFG